MMSDTANTVSVESYLPAEILRPFIKKFMIVESERETVHKLLPDTSIVMGFRYKGRTFTGSGNKPELPAFAVSGLTKSARLLGYAPKTATLLIRFTEGGASAFSDGPLNELFELHVSLDHLISRSNGEDIGEKLAQAKDNLQRFSIIQRFMISMLKAKEPSRDPLILDSVQTIKLANGNVRIKNLAASLFISQDQFEKRFRQTIGTSPKQFAKTVRLRSLIGNYPRAQNLADAALKAGYFDQAHFIKDFKSFTGQTPKDYFSSLSS